MCPMFGVSEKAKRWGHPPPPKPNAAAVAAAEMPSVFPAARYRIPATLGNASWKTTAPIRHVMLWTTW